jgi:hypothetical protein
MYCCDLPNEEDQPAFYETFARAFMMTTPMWREFVREARETGAFPRRDVFSWGRGGRMVRSSLDLMVLGALRVLTKGWSFEAVAEATFIGKETHRIFFREFTKHGSIHLCPRHVQFPRLPTEFADANHEFEMGGFPGCVHDSDGCIFPWPGAAMGNQNLCKSYKNDEPAVNCLLSWDHRHKVLNYTLGVGSMIDEVLQPRDDFLMGVYDGTLAGDESFCLVCKQGNGTLMRQKHTGVYGLHDNGFLKWGTAAGVPFKHTLTMGQKRFSEMVESMRKGSECGNRDLKSRFLLFKQGFRQRSFAEVEDAVRTALALHNWRKDIDGFFAPWPTQKRLGCRLTDDESAPERMGMLSEPVIGTPATNQQRDFVLSLPSSPAPPIHVNQAGFQSFRNALCVHWNILWDRRLIFWPTRLGPLRLTGDNDN